MNTKKPYMTPRTEEIVLCIESLMQITVSGGGNANAEVSQEKFDADEEWASRRRSGGVWDDQEEDY